MSVLLDELLTLHNVARGYKTFFMLNSAEHEILSAYKNKNIKKFSIIQAHISLECYVTMQNEIMKKKMILIFISFCTGIIDAK